MAISISTFYDDIVSTLKKTNSSFVSPGDVTNAANKACIDILHEFIKEYENTPNRFSVDQTLLKLHSFSGSATVRDLPSDVFKVSSIFNLDFEGDILDDKTFNDRAKSVIIPPAGTRPIATLYYDGGAKIRILPQSTDHKIKYWKNPTKCVYNFTQSNGVITFNPTGSVDIDFPMSEYTRIFNRTLTYLTPIAKDPDSAQLEQNILR